MVAHMCWSCKVHSQVVREGDVSLIQNIEGLDGPFDLYSVAMRCQWCGNMNIAIVQVHAHTDPAEVREKVDRGSNIQLWRPTPRTEPNLGAVPAHIAEPAREVYRARDVGARRASALMGRAVIEAIAKDHGVTQRISLEAKIKKLHENGIILASTADDAHEVRHLGNEMAHGDFSTEVTDEDVNDIIAIMYDLIEQLYVSAARRKRMRERREARESTAG